MKNCFHMQVCFECKHSSIEPLKLGWKINFLLCDKRNVLIYVFNGISTDINAPAFLSSQPIKVKPLRNGVTFVTVCKPPLFIWYVSGEGILVTASASGSYVAVYFTVPPLPPGLSTSASRTAPIKNPSKTSVEFGTPST